MTNRRRPEREHWGESYRFILEQQPISRERKLPEKVEGTVAEKKKLDGKRITPIAKDCSTPQHKNHR
ncbi:hypothetical protein GE061_011141 [Apolygus lucorum]|uniref:Uncharacterized protein n=1 Tax=Apolygus lucorum TaxID=248454 RepID=A0A6A4JUB1_APOLU|nr:hypothetical protein GE061_011141 [Apolygus lucorum]